MVSHLSRHRGVWLHVFGFCALLGVWCCWVPLAQAQDKTAVLSFWDHLHFDPTISIQGLCVSLALIWQVWSATRKALRRLSELTDYAALVPELQTRLKQIEEQVKVLPCVRPEGQYPP